VVPLSSKIYYFVFGMSFGYCSLFLYEATAKTPKIAVLLSTIGVALGIALASIELDKHFSTVRKNG